MTDDVIIAFLLQFPAIGGVAKGYPYGRLPQKRDGQISAELPAFTVSLWDRESWHTNEDGLSCWRPMRCQVDVWARTGKEVADLAESIRRLLDGYRGGMSDHSVGGVFGNTSLPTAFEPEVELYRRTLDYDITFTS